MNKTPHCAGFFYARIVAMADPTHDQLLQETYKLARDNNRMLHAMRRDAFIGGIIKLLMYAVAVGVPIWFFVTYALPIVNSATNTLNQVQGQIQSAKDAGMQMSAPLQGLEDLMNQVKNIPGFGGVGQEKSLWYDTFHMLG